VIGRSWAWAGLLWLAACSSSPPKPKPAGDACLGGVAIASVDVELPGGMSSISSLQASGDCVPAPFGCSPACDGGGCDCTRSVSVVDGKKSPTAVCHIQVTSSLGQVFTRDVSFALDTSGTCPSLDPSVAKVTVDFADASIPDASGD
jgi:hypothetical protein